MVIMCLHGIGHFYAPAIQRMVERAYSVTVPLVCPSVKALNHHNHNRIF